MDAKKGKLAQGKSQAEGRKDSDGENEYNTLEDSGHGHHRKRPI